MTKKKIIILGTLISFIFFVIQLLTLGDYGINWDEPVHYMRGQAYLRYFMTGKRNYDGMSHIKTQLPKAPGVAKIPQGTIYESDKNYRRSLYQNDQINFDYFIQKDSGHPPLNDIFASLSNYIFYQKLGWVGDIESYHLFVVSVSSLLVFFIFVFTSTYYGLISGLIASLALILYPLFLGESHFNIKDPVEASFYSIVLMAAFFSFTKKSWKWLLASFIVAGLALGTKFNILFAPFVVLVWLIIKEWDKLRRKQWPFTRIFTAVLIFGTIIPFVILFISWPYLWQDPLRNFFKIIGFYKNIGYNSTASIKMMFFGINTYAFQWILFSTPLVVLFFAIFGILYSFFKGIKEKERVSLFILLWFGISILRVSTPNAEIYGGVRQIMEYIPAMAILSGIGVYWILKIVEQKFKKLLVGAGVLIIILFTPILIRDISIHPNENVYFNPLIGGLKGAAEKNFPDWGTTLGSVYKDGIDWINIHAEKNSKVALLKGLLSNIPRIKIRKDIYFSEFYYSGEKKDGEYLMEVVDYRYNEILKEKRNYLEKLIPVYEEKVDGITILKIWKNDTIALAK